MITSKQLATGAVGLRELTREEKLESLEATLTEAEAMILPTLADKLAKVEALLDEAEAAILPSPQPNKEAGDEVPPEDPIAA